MTVLAISALALALIEGLIFAETLRSVLRTAARERGQLLDQVCHLAGKQWRPPPALPETELPELDHRYVFAPEQEPDF